MATKATTKAPSKATAKKAAPRKAASGKAKANWTSARKARSKPSRGLNRPMAAPSNAKSLVPGRETWWRSALTTREA